jgi:hypothetical protein
MSTSCTVVCPAAPLSISKQAYNTFNLFIGGAVAFVAGLQLNEALLSTVEYIVCQSEGENAQSLSARNSDKLNCSTIAAKLWRQWLIAILILVVGVGLLILLSWIGNSYIT